MANSTWTDLFYGVSHSGTATTFTGPIYLPDGSAGAPSLTFTSDTTKGLYSQGTNIVGAALQGALLFQWDATGSDNALNLLNAPLKWATGGTGTTPNLYLRPDAANTLALRNGTTAQEQRWYQTFTDASNYARGFIDANVTSTNTLTIGTKSQGTGPNMGIQFAPVNTAAWQMNTSGNFLDLGSHSITAGSTITSAVSFINSNATNGQKITDLQTLTELTTIAAAASTDTTIQMPANAVVLAVAVRVTTIIPTAATFTVGDSGSATRFSTAAVAVAAGSTDPGTKAGAYYNASALSVRITPNAQPADNTGRVRVVIYYYSVTPPTS